MNIKVGENVLLLLFPNGEFCQSIHVNNITEADSWKEEYVWEGPRGWPWTGTVE